jgi:signal transduction histidine kinase
MSESAAQMVKVGPASGTRFARTHYNGGVAEATFERIGERIGYSDEDAEWVRALGRDLGAALPALVDRFYARLFESPGARAVFTGGEAQISRQRIAFGGWLQEVLEARYDAELLARRLVIGATHVRVGLPQEYMLIGMELIWQEIEHWARGKQLPEVDQKLRSLHKLFTVELALMLETYRQGYTQVVQQDERSAVREQLTRAENLAEIGQIAATLAHEIKNPLAGISGAIQIIGDGMHPDSPHRIIVSEMLAQIQRLNATVKDLLHYARPPAPSPLRYNLNKVVKRVLTVLHAEPALQRLRVDFSGGGPFLPVFVDEGQLEQVVMNLVINAAQACSPGGIIRIHTDMDAEGARLRVQDTGQGMTPEVQARAFDAFFTTKAKGTGLGLAICRKIVEAQGGKITLESAVGHGTTVTVRFPYPPDAPDNPEAL